MKGTQKTAHMHTRARARARVCVCVCAREYRCLTERQGLNDTNFPQGTVKYCFLIFALMIAVAWTVAWEDDNYPQTKENCQKM